MRLALPRPTRLAYEWYALAASAMQQERTSAFPGGRGVMACSDARWGFRIMHEARRAFGTGGGGVD